MDQIASFKSIVITSSTPDVTADFYREVLGLPLEEEQHRGTARHWACQVGSLHFAIHQRAGFWLPSLPAAGSPAAPDTVVSFNADVERFSPRLAQHGIEIVAHNKIGPMTFVAVRDPDQRTVCLGTPWPERSRRAQ
jgi:catechol 2,3-dioxygenase-like lactoylglutathione lyase family enzyme